MRCKNCHYSLANLTGPPHRCPECGREFDPNDPETFEHSKSEPRLGLILASTLIAGGFGLGFAVAYVFQAAMSYLWRRSWDHIDVATVSATVATLFWPFTSWLCVMTYKRYARSFRPIR